MAATLETRFEGSGFAYTSRTRMGFSPKFTVTRREEDHKSSDLVIWPANGQPEPTRADIGEIIHALATACADRRIMLDTPDGLVPVFEPDKTVAGTAAGEDRATPIRPVAAASRTA